MPIADIELGSPAPYSDLLPSRQLLMNYPLNSMKLRNFCNRDFKKFYDRIVFSY
jgi:hypothetical protein